MGGTILFLLIGKLGAAAVVPVLGPFRVLDSQLSLPGSLRTQINVPGAVDARLMLPGSIRTQIVAENER